MFNSKLMFDSKSTYNGILFASHFELEVLHLLESKIRTIFQKSTFFI